ncbi:MAG: hypothetical protein ACRDSZ_17525 [Pseudonocardiaceae bacterium]
MTLGVPVTGSGPRRVLSATCTVHGDARGFTNLVIRKLEGGGVEFDPHAVGGCVVNLDKAATRALREILIEWLA